MGTLPALRSHADGWTPPEAFDEYRLVSLIGRGTTGRVYLARDTLLERPVAVKFVRALGPHALARFLVEARAAARVQHPNVVTLYRVGQLENHPYLISEFVRGTSLDRLERPLPWERVLALGRDLARGLGAAHRRGVLHRDIKPANAILTETGEVKLLDFGLAKLLDADLPWTEAGAGGSPPGKGWRRPWRGSSTGWTCRPCPRARSWARLIICRRRRGPASRSRRAVTCTRWGGCSTSCARAWGPSTR